MTDPLYTYAWGNNAKRKTLQGRKCVVVQRLKMNSVIVRFEDTGEIEVVSRNALRRVKETI